MSIRVLQPDEIEKITPLLLLAEPSEVALRYRLNQLSDMAYGMESNGQWIGAATVSWQSDPSEVLELAIAPEHQRQGLGKQFVAWLVAEAQRKGKPTLVAGASNASIGNILFLQKCGFRVDHVRTGYLEYYRKPRYENGIRVRDLIVFRHDLAQENQKVNDAAHSA